MYVFDYTNKVVILKGEKSEDFIGIIWWTSMIGKLHLFNSNGKEYKDQEPKKKMQRI